MLNIKCIRRFALMSLCCLPLGLLAQADAGEDKTICDGATVEIGTAGNADYCYSWNPETDLDDPSSPQPMASPSMTTTYTLTVFSEDFANKWTDDVVLTVDTAKVELEVEEMLTECMEGRTLTYTATANEVFDHDDPISFTFHYQYANGTNWETTDWSFDLVEDNTVMADQVPDGDADHKFDTPIYVVAENDDCMATSPTLTITVYELWIEFVRHDAANPWKAIVGSPFAYSGIASADCVGWSWTMDDGAPQWNPAGNAKNGNMTIPNADLPNENTPFGDTFGTVNVSCDDGEGNNHTFASTDMMPAMKVKVFYNATATTNPVGGDPNWYVYYESNYGVAALSYDCSGGGRSSSNSGGGDASVKICDEAYAGDTYILTMVAAGQLSATGWSGNTRHYANFVGVADHERQHANNETTAGPPADTDNDFLTTAYENATSQTDPTNKYSARGVLVGAAWDDGEVYAGGPIEGGGIGGANTTNDWAQPGTNWP